jgi:hypothetical protein
VHGDRDRWLAVGDVVASDLAVPLGRMLDGLGETGRQDERTWQLRHTVALG